MTFRKSTPKPLTINTPAATIALAVIARAAAEGQTRVVASEISSLLDRHWGLTTVDVRPLSGGMNSQTWLVRHANATYVAKRVAPSALHQLAAGGRIAADLAEAGLVTGRPVPTRDGQLVVAGDALTLLEFVPGRELDGQTDQEQRWIADMLGRVHTLGAPSSQPRTSTFFAWLNPEAPGVDAQPWLAAAISAIRAETDPLDLTWSTLHADPAPEAFRRHDASGVTGLIDWTDAQRGPILYDIASAVMYLDGPLNAVPFLEAYRACGPLGTEELQHLDTFRRFRWAVQAVYFLGRLASNDLTGIQDQTDNDRGFADARHGLAELGAAVS